MKWLAVACAALVLAGCTRHAGRDPLGFDAARPSPATTNGIESDPATSVDSFDVSSTMGPVFFDYDSYALTSEALECLKTHAPRIQLDEGRILLGGHCDERGTQEYNMALGEQRALAVKRQLVRLGVPETRLATISYGEEMPADAAHDEAAWHRNRRVEFNVPAAP
jgi:peptidoglycan-associated lipoprotein